MTFVGVRTKCDGDENNVSGLKRFCLFQKIDVAVTNQSGYPHFLQGKDVSRAGMGCQQEAAGRDVGGRGGGATQRESHARTCTRTLPSWPQTPLTNASQ